MANDLEPRVSLNGLADALRECAELYRSGEVEDQRTAVVASLTATHQFLRSQGIDARYLEPLFRPVDALATLDKNGLDPLFTAGRKGGRPRVQEDQQNRSGILAALADFWIAHHGANKVLDVVLGEAARAIRGRWSGAVTKAEMKAARALVSQEAADHPAVITAESARAALDKLLAEVGEPAALDTFLARLNVADPSPALGNWSTLMGSGI